MRESRDRDCRFKGYLLNQYLRVSRLFYKGRLKSVQMPEGKEPGIEGLGAFGDASTIVHEFQASAHGVTGHWSCYLLSLIN